MNKLAILIGSTREGHFGDAPAAWIRDLAAARGDAECTIVDLNDFPLPAHFPSPEADAWRARVAEFDG